MDPRIGNDHGQSGPADRPATDSRRLDPQRVLEALRRAAEEAKRRAAASATPNTTR
jgi:hypothetical protein